MRAVCSLSLGATTTTTLHGRSTFSAYCGSEASEAGFCSASHLPRRLARVQL